jgi:uncharacterized protein (DUF983 family)
MSGSSAEPSLARAALSCRCPRCGKGPIYRGVLALRDACPACGLDLREVDTGDGGAFAGIMVVSIVVVVLAFWVDFRFSPPIWVHAIVWPIVTVVLSILVMRMAKAGLVAAQYRYRKREMGL